MNRTSLAAFTLLCAPILLHCGADQTPVAAPPPAASLAPAELPPVPTVGPDAGAAPIGGQSAVDAHKPDAGEVVATSTDAVNDKQIAAITDAANDAEVEQGKLARLTSKSPAVQKFAAQMIAAHEEAKKNQDKLQLPTEESSLGNQLGTESTKAMNLLKGSSASDFDKAYIDAQVEQHQQFLNALNDRLLPNVKNADLKAYLQTVQRHAARHLKEAQDLQQALGNTPSTVSTNHPDVKHGKP